MGGWWGSGSLCQSVSREKSDSEIQGTALPVASCSQGPTARHIAAQYSQSSHFYPRSWARQYPAVSRFFSTPCHARRALRIAAPGGSPVGAFVHQLYSVHLCTRWRKLSVTLGCLGALSSRQPDSWAQSSSPVFLTHGLSAR